jgi:hypothetical protein
MRRDIQLLVPLVIFGLGLSAVAVGLFLLTGLKWDAVLEDVGVVEQTERAFSIPLPTSIPSKVSWNEPTKAPTSEPTATEVTLERRPHNPNTRTGVEDIDRIIDLVLGVDDNAIMDALNFTLAGCTHTDGLGGPPKCKGGEYEGTQVEVLPIIGPEGHFFRKDEIDDWRGIGVVGLYAAYEVSEDAFSDENYPAGEFAVMFIESDHQFLVLQIENGGVVRIDYVFGNDPEAKIEREARRVILAPLPHGVIPLTGLGLTVPGWTLSQLTSTPSPGDIWNTPTPDNIGSEKSDPGDYATPSAPLPTQVPSDPTYYPSPTAASETPEPTESAEEQSSSATPTTSTPPPEFTNLILTRYPYLRKSQVVFPKGTPFIYAVWDYAGMQEGMVLRREWYRHGELWLEREERWDFAKYGSSGTMFDISIYDFMDGLDPGTYVLDLYVDDVQLATSWWFYVKERLYSVVPQASPDGTYLASVELPGTIVLQEWGRKAREFITVDEVASLAWFPGGEHLLYVNVNRFEQDELHNMMVGFETWVANIKTGERKIIASTAEDFREGKPSPGGRYVAGISGTGWGDACFYDSFLMVLKLDRDHNHIATYRLEAFGGESEDLGWNTRRIHPRNIQWVNRYQFTAELREHCLPSFDTGVYLFDLKTMEVKKVRDLYDGQAWSQ